MIQFWLHESNCYMQVFEQWREVHNFGTTWSLAEYRENNPTVEDIQKDMERMTTWHSDIDRNMRPGYPVGIFQVESRKLKNAMLPIADKALCEMESLLLDSFHEKCESTLTLYQERIRVLDTEPAVVKQFAEHVSRVREISTEVERLSKLSSQVELMNDLLTNSAHKLAIPPQDQVLLDELRGARKGLAEQISLSEEFVYQRMPEMRENVDQNIVRLNNELLAISGSLKEGIFIDNHAEPENVLQELQKVSSKLENITEQADTLNHYQGTFEIEPYQFGQLDTAKEAFAAKLEFWKLYSDWLQLTDEWEDGDFFEIDVEEMNSTVNRFAKDAFRMNKREASQVTLKVRTLVEEWKTLMPMILELGNKAMQQKHWDVMFAFVGQTFHPNEQLRLRIW